VSLMSPAHPRQASFTGRVSQAQRGAPERRMENSNPEEDDAMDAPCHQEIGICGIDVTKMSPPFDRGTGIAAVLAS
jgi:hypothetical protein